MHPTVTLTRELIQCASVTPNDAGCMDIISNRLAPLGFAIESFPFGEVKNFWARIGTGDPLFCFLGHTDVVPTGPEELWKYPPFSATVHEDFLYGRGAADMKGSVAAMCIAVENFLKKHHHFKGSIALLLTSDEEGPSIDGVAKVAPLLAARGDKITWCLVGEPSSENHFGDTIKIGRRGTLTGFLKIIGKQGHVAYPEKADNPIHRALAMLTTLSTEIWDEASDFFPATSLQISNIHAGTGATNVIPSDLSVTFNFRYSPSSEADHLMQEVEQLLQSHGLRYELKWHHSGKPFLTQQGKLLNACQSAIEQQCQHSPRLSTHGGTSDGRFIAPFGSEVIEVGPNNATIHQIDERVSITELIELTALYESILQGLFV